MQEARGSMLAGMLRICCGMLPVCYFYQLRQFRHFLGDSRLLFFFNVWGSCVPKNSNLGINIRFCDSGEYGMAPKNTILAYCFSLMFGEVAFQKMPHLESISDFVILGSMEWRKKTWKTRFLLSRGTEHSASISEHMAEHIASILALSSCISVPYKEKNRGKHFNFYLFAWYAGT